MMKKNKIRYLFGCLAMLVVGIVVCVVILVSPALAANNGLVGVSYFDKALYEQLAKCYKEGAFQSGFTLSEFTAASNKLGFLDPSSSTKVYLVSGRYTETDAHNKETDDSVDEISCSELLFGADPEHGTFWSKNLGTTFNGILAGVMYQMQHNDPEHSLDYMGYEKHESETGGSCAYFTYSSIWQEGYGGYPGLKPLDPVSSTDSFVTNTICAETSDGKISSNKLELKEPSVGHQLLKDPQGNMVLVFNAEAENQLKICRGKYGEDFDQNTYTTKKKISAWDCETLSFNVGDSWESFLSNSNPVENGNYSSVQSVLSSPSFYHQKYLYNSGFSDLWGGMCAYAEFPLLPFVMCGYMYDYTLNPSYVSLDLTDLETKYYLNSEDYVSPMKAIRNLSGNNGYANYSTLEYSGEEKVQLYRYYIENFFNDPGERGVVCRLSSDESVEHNGLKARVGNDLVSFSITNGNTSEVMNCYAKKPTKNKDVTVNGLKSNQHFGEKVTFSVMIDQLDGTELYDNALIADLLAGSMGDPENTDPDKPDTNYGTDKWGEAKCYDGSGPIGWLVCPLVKMTSGIGNSLWKSIEKSFMVVSPELFDTNNGVYIAWGAIRNIANIFFIILFMFVIFSQLTGVGIDNYGIKKILPKLILVAVLANLSWVVCELAADLTNIVGSGISGLLSGAAESIVTSSSTEVKQLVVGGAGEAVLGGGGAVLFILLNGGWNLAGVAALGLAVLGVVITLVSGIVVMYLILIIREAGIILLIALAPVAIVCYALPNTEKMYKKWFNLFKALLVVYPLCGAALGAGKLASAVLANIGGSDGASLLVDSAAGAISSGDLPRFINTVFAAENSGKTGIMLAAVIVQVLPYFFIPKLLKSSLSLMGNIGEKISRTGKSLGRRASSTVQSGVKNSESYRQFQQYRQNKSSVRKATRVKNRRWFYDKDGNLRKDLSDRQMDKINRANEVLLAEENRKKRIALGSSEMGYKSSLSHQDVAFSNEREKMFAEDFASKDRGELVKMLEQQFGDEALGEDGMTDERAEEMSALMKTINSMGGEKDVMSFLSKNNKWSDNQKTKNRLLMAMGSSRVDALQSYSKYALSGGKASFGEWMSGTGEVIERERREAEEKIRNGEEVTIKDMTYAKHVSEMGPDAFNGYSKDEMEFVEKNAEALIRELGAQKFGSMVSNAAINSKSGKAQTVSERIIRDNMRKGLLSGNDLGLTAEGIGNMREETADAIYYGYRDKRAQESGIADENGRFDESKYNALDEQARKRFDHNVTADMHKDFGKQARAIESNNKIRDRAKDGVKNRFGIKDSFDANGATPPRPVLLNNGGANLGGTGGSGSGSGSSRSGSTNGRAGNVVFESGGILLSGEQNHNLQTPTEKSKDYKYTNAIPKEYRASSFEDASPAGVVPVWVQDDQDFKQLVAGVEASEKLSALQNMGYEEASKKVELPPDINDEAGFRQYTAQLETTLQDTSNLEQYRTIQNKTFEQASSANATPTWVQDDLDYRQYQEGIEAATILPKIQGKSYSDVGLSDEESYQKYKADLEQKMQRMEQVKIYNTIKDLDYGQASKAKVLPKGVNDEATYREAKEQYGAYYNEARKRIVEADKTKPGAGGAGGGPKGTPDGGDLDVR